MNKSSIEYWLNKKDESIHFPSEELVAKLKNIPSEKKIVNQPYYSWILWFAAASFIGFMIINFSYLNNNSTNENSLDTYFSTTITH
jgi:hypothetical protein